MTDPITPTPAPSSPSPEATTPPATNASPTPAPNPALADGTPLVSSADADNKPIDGAKPEDAPQPKNDAAAQAEAARATVHEKAEDYAVNLEAADREALGLAEDDPMVAHLQKVAAEGKKPQGWLDDVLSAAAELQKAGLFDAGFDPAAEAAKLGETAPARRREVEVFADALKARGDIDDAEFGELMSLAPTAAGVTLIEKLRKMMTDGGKIPTPTGDAPDEKTQAQAKAKEMTADPRYQTDRRFRREADEAWKNAFGGRV